MILLITVVLNKMGKVHTWFQATYAAIKYALGYNKRKPPKIIQYTLLTLTVSTMIVLSVALFVLNLFAMTVNAYLKLHHGEKYGGMIKYLDFHMEAGEKVLGMNAVCIVKRNGSYEDFEKAMYKTFEKLHDSCSKLTYEVETFLGYKYYLKSNVKFKEVFTVVDYVSLTRDNLAEYLKDSVMNITFLRKKAWRLLVVKQPIKWTNNGVQAEHLIILIFRHSVTDGVGLTHFLAANHNGFELVPIVEKYEKDPRDYHKSSLDDTYVHDFAFTESKSFPRSGCSTYLTFHVENEAKYVPLIKVIKAKLHIGFTDVISGCLADALATYAKKKGNRITDVHISFLTTAMDQDRIDMFRGKFDYNKLSNKMLHYTMHINPDNKLKEIAQQCHRQAQEMKESADLALSEVIMRTAHTLTVPIYRRLQEKVSKSFDLVISNLGVAKSLAIDEHVVESLLFFGSESNYVGFAVNTRCIKNKLHTFFQGPKSILNNRKDLDEILDDMFRNINNLYNEIENIM